MAAACVSTRLAPLPLGLPKIERLRCAQTIGVRAVPAVSRKNVSAASQIGRNALLGAGQIGKTMLFDPMGQQHVRSGLKQGRSKVQMEAVVSEAASLPDPGVPSAYAHSILMRFFQATWQSIIVLLFKALASIAMVLPWWKK